MSQDDFNVYDKMDDYDSKTVSVVSPTNFSYPYEQTYESHPIVYELKTIVLNNLCPACGGQTFGYCKDTAAGRIFGRCCMSGKTTGCLL